MGALLRRLARGLPHEVRARTSATVTAATRSRATPTSRCAQFVYTGPLDFRPTDAPR